MGCLVMIPLNLTIDIQISNDSAEQEQKIIFKIFAWTFLYIRYRNST